jgi:rhodanese-related sulfurtransferase
LLKESACGDDALTGVGARRIQEVRMSVSIAAATIATISTADLAQRTRDDIGLHVWNVLTDDYFKGELIPGSRRVPVDRLGEALRRSSLAKDAAIVVYCAGPTCPQSRQAAEKLVGFGYTHVAAYEGGLEEWKAAGFGVVGPGTAPQAGAAQ